MYTAPPLNTLADPLLQLADAMPQLVWITNAAGAVIYFNQRISEYKGILKAADGLWEWQDAIHPDDLGDTGLSWMHSIATGLPYEKEHRMRMTDGTYRWHLARALPQRDAEGNIVNWYGTSTDIHQQKLSEQTLRESEERFRLLTNSIPQIVWIVDSDGKTEYVNDRWTSYTGQDEEHATREGRITMIHPDDLPVVLDLWSMAQQQEMPMSWEYRIRNQETDRYRWFSAYVLPLKNEDGKVIRWVCAASDIQAHKDSTGLLEHEVALRTRALEQSNEDLQQFAHVASHDLKEPLRKIRTFVSRLSQEFKDVLPGQSNEYLAKIETSAARMAEMIDGVLHYSMIDDEEGHSPELVPLGAVLRNVEMDLEVVIQAKSAVIETGPLPSVVGVPVLLHQLFVNLVNNALKFVRPGMPPRIKISTQPVNAAEWPSLAAGKNYVAVSVSDNGIGFEPDYARSIFKTFTRLHSKDSFEGSGLGLALCQKIVQRHGGAIGAEGKPNAGATFTVVLPQG